MEQSGVVQATSSTPRSFVVEMPGGETVRRNHRQLQIVNQEADDTQIGMKSTSPDCSVVTHKVLGPAGCEPEAAGGTQTPFKVTRSGRVVKPVVKLTLQLVGREV